MPNDLPYNLRFFGWYYDPKNDHDKVWGWVEIEGKLYNFWGRRGGKFSFKRHEVKWDLESLTFNKVKKGYKRIMDPETVCPNFYKEFGRQLVTARMFGKVRSEGHAGYDS